MNERYEEVEKLLLSSWSSVHSEPQIALFKCRLILEKIISVFLENIGAPIEGNVHEQITTLKNGGIKDDVRRLMRAIQELANMGAHDYWNTENFSKIAEACLIMNNVILREAKKLDGFDRIVIGGEGGDFSKFIKCSYCGAAIGTNCRKYFFEGKNHVARIKDSRSAFGLD